METRFCDLTEATTAKAVVQGVASAMDIALVSDSATHEVMLVARAMRARGSVLLVADNLEQVVSAAAAAIGAWLDACPELRILATSRERLGVEGERCVELEPLSGEHAMALFRDRAEAVRGKSDGALEKTESIAALCARLDCIPLALELAAAQTAIYTPAQLLERLSDRFSLLRSKRRDARARQATLRGAIDASWDLLTEAERHALASFSVFRGGFSFAAADAVLLSPGKTGAADLAERLCEKYVLVSYEPPELPGESRFRMFESIREHAAEKLSESGNRGVIEERHARHYLALAERSAQGISGPRAVECLKRLSLERDNVLVAHAALSRRDPEGAIRIVLALDRLLSLYGPFELDAELLDVSVEQARAAGLRRLEARTLAARSEIRRLNGSIAGRDDAERDLEHAREIAEREHDPELLATVLRVRGRLNRSRGRVDEAAGCFEAALASVPADARVLRGALLDELAATIKMAGRVAEAEATLRESIGLLSDAGERVIQPTAWAHLGSVCCERARWGEALAHYRRALAMHVENGNQREETVTLYLIGGVLAELGEAAEARAMLLRALRAAREIGARVYELEPLFRLAMVELDSGNADEAERLLHEAQKTAREVGNRGAEAAVLAWLGMAHQLRGALAPASNALIEAIDLARKSNVPWREAHALAHLAAVRALDPSARQEARSGFAAARAIADRIGDPGLFATIRLLEELLDFDRSRIEALEKSSNESPSINARVARAILRRALDIGTAPEARPPRASPTDVATDTDIWRFASSGKWFSRGASPRVELFTRRPLQRLVKRLIDQHAEKGDGLSVDDLLAAGWPNERVAGRSGASRVYNAVTTLKKLGLDPILLRRNDGYMLDPSAHVVVADDRSSQRGR